MHLLLGLLTLLTAGEPASPPAPPVVTPVPAVTSSGLVEIDAIVLVVGAKGSEQTQRERAILSPGRKGLLQVAVSLPR